MAQLRRSPTVAGAPSAGHPHLTDGQDRRRPLRPGRAPDHRGPWPRHPAAPTGWPSCCAACSTWTSSCRASNWLQLLSVHGCRALRASQGNIWLHSTPGQASLAQPGPCSPVAACRTCRLCSPRPPIAEWTPTRCFFTASAFMAGGSDCAVPSNPGIWDMSGSCKVVLEKDRIYWR